MSNDILDILIKGTSGCWDMFNAILAATGMTGVVISVIVVAMIARLIIAPLVGYRFNFSDRNEMNQRGKKGG